MAWRAVLSACLPAVRKWRGRLPKTLYSVIFTAKSEGKVTEFESAKGLSARVKRYKSPLRQWWAFPPFFNACWATCGCRKVADARAIWSLRIWAMTKAQTLVPIRCPW